MRAARRWGSGKFADATLRAPNESTPHHRRVHLRLSKCSCVGSAVSRPPTKPSSRASLERGSWVEHPRQGPGLGVTIDAPNVLLDNEDACSLTSPSFAAHICGIRLNFFTPQNFLAVPGVWIRALLFIPNVAVLPLPACGIR